MILVTGGAGYIGSHTVVELAKKGHNIIVIDNLSNSSKKSISNIQRIIGKKVLFFPYDVRNRRDLMRVFNSYDIEGVLHFAGSKAVGESVQKPIEYYLNNISGTLTLLDVMKYHQCKKIIFSSSATVYGNPKELPIKENASLSVINPYGRSKLIIEDILKDLYQSDNSWGIGILRYFNPVGSHHSGLIGEQPNGMPTNLMPIVSMVAAGKIERLKIFGGDYETDDGTGIRDYIHVEDLAKGHVKAFDILKNGFKLEIINLGTGKGYSVLELVREYEKVSKCKINFDITERREGDVACCFADVSYAKKVLNWSAQYNLEYMCESSWKWQKSISNPLDK